MQPNMVKVRTAGLAAIGLMAVLTLGACGSSANSASSSTIATLTSTNFVQLPTVPSTTTTTIAVVPGGPLTSESTYTVQPGDYPSTIASKFKVKYVDLATLNGWDPAANQVPGFAPGIVIKIPAGATMPGGATTETTAAPAAGTETATTVAAGGTSDTTTTTAGGEAPAGSSTTVAAAGDCQTGSYTIKAEDTTRIKVAEKFNVTVDQLDAANSGTNGYSAFYPGLKIVIPAKAGC